MKVLQWDYYESITMGLGTDPAKNIRDSTDNDKYQRDRFLHCGE
jgi:hypothetical protein